MDTSRVLILNWKDLRHPQAGGAEVFTHEVAKRLSAGGRQVTVFASAFPNGPSQEVVDGVEIVRGGTKFSVYRKARDYLRDNGHDFDVIFEEVNTRPFFARPPSPAIQHFVIIHQLAREFWNAEFPLPLAAVGRYILEPLWLRRLRDERVLVPSPSTRSDLEKLGFTRISEFRYGLSNEPLEQPTAKADPPTLLFIGRLKATKGPGDALKAFLHVRRTVDEARMLVVGGGPLLEELRRRYEPLGVRFLGPTPESVKLDLLKQAHLLLIPGVREGWGLVVTEANSMATPTIAYDVPGLRDSVRNGETGILVPAGDYEGMARECVALLKDRTRYERLRSQALAHSRNFTWDKTTETLEGFMNDRAT